MLPRVRLLVLGDGSPVRPENLWLDNLFIVFSAPDPEAFVAAPRSGIIAVRPGEGAATVWLTRSAIDAGGARVSAVSVAGRSEAYLFGA